MSKDAKSSGCLGVFFKTFIVGLLLIGGSAIGLIALGVRFLSWNVESFTRLDGWSSYPAMIAIGVILCSLFVAFAVASFIGFASAFLGKGSSKSRSSASSSRVRQYSQRKTTV